MKLAREIWFERTLWPAALAMVAVIAVSNWAVQFPINDWLTWGAFTYPLVFLVVDLTNRACGPARARRVVMVGFVFGLLVSLTLADARIAVASGAAYLASQWLDIWIFDRLRRGQWWRAPLVSSLLAMAIDTGLFYGGSFALTGLPWVTWAVGDYAVKLAMAACVLPAYRLLIVRLPDWQPPRPA